MKCVQFTDPRVVNGVIHTRILRVDDATAEKLVRDPINLGLRKYVPKHLYKQQKGQ